VKEFVMTFSFTKVPRAKGGTQKIKTTQPYFPNNFIQTVSNKQPFRNGVVMLQHTKKQCSPNIKFQGLAIILGHIHTRKKTDFPSEAWRACYAKIEDAMLRQSWFVVFLQGQPQLITHLA
jgi:hypothetical protein